ncbi:hypothetical protein ACVWZW_006700 [Bradyrhizobium sp. F1.13.4]
MKMISSTSITSMNGVTLISWVTSRSSGSPRLSGDPDRAPSFAAMAYSAARAMRNSLWSRCRLTSNMSCAEASPNSAR